MTDRHTDRQTDTQTETQTDRQTEWWGEKHNTFFQRYSKRQNYLSETHLFFNNKTAAGAI